VGGKGFNPIRNSSSACHTANFFGQSESAEILVGTKNGGGKNPPAANMLLLTMARELWKIDQDFCQRSQGGFSVAEYIERDSRSSDPADLA